MVRLEAWIREATALGAIAAEPTPIPKPDGKPADAKKPVKEPSKDANGKPIRVVRGCIDAMPRGDGTKGDKHFVRLGPDWDSKPLFVKIRGVAYPVERQTDPDGYIARNVKLESLQIPANRPKPVEKPGNDAKSVLENLRLTEEYNSIEGTVELQNGQIVPVKIHVIHGL